MKCKYLIAHLILTAFTFVSAEEKTIVLQNGLGNYNACADSYVYRKGDDPSSVDQNYAKNPYLMTSN